MVIQYFQYQLFDGTQPVDDLKNQPNITIVECGLWSKNGLYIGYIESASQDDIDTAINNYQTKYNFVKKTTTEVETIIDGWTINAENPFTDVGVSKTINPATTNVNGYVEKTLS